MTERRDAIAILDYGSQYSQLIARRIREAHVYCQLYPFDAPPEEVLALDPVGFVLSGGPNSVYDPGAPRIPEYVFSSGRPVLGICYGMQAMAHALGGAVAPSRAREYGRAEIEVPDASPLLEGGRRTVWMSHGDRIDRLPTGFQPLATTDNSPFAAMGDPQRSYYGVQFHPEVQHTVGGVAMLRRFAVEICGASPDWTPGSIARSQIDRIRALAPEGQLLAAVSGGVDSSVAAALAHRAVGDRLTCVFVNTGLLRAGEPESVVDAFRRSLGAHLVAVDASETFLAGLEGISDPEKKRSIIGELFIRTFENEARRLGDFRYLIQGTIYPDVVESSAPERQSADRIKTHHNVGGLPKQFDFELIEPLRYLFKDEVRAVGSEVGLPSELVWRQPFPGPGFAVRCLGEVSFERVERLRKADKIVTEELERAGLLNRPPGDEDRAEIAQAFAVLLPVQSVGVMGDNRTYQEVLAVRAVSSEDFMTADWARLPSGVLEAISRRIVNEVAGINRVVYDITSKPPATIEWE